MRDAQSHSSQEDTEHFIQPLPSLQTWQSLRQCAYIVTQVAGAPELPYLHEWACHCALRNPKGSRFTARAE